MSRRSPHRRIHPLVSYLAVLATSIAGYFAYLNFVVPVVEVTAEPIRKFQTEAIVDDTHNEDVEHHLWFSDGDWELQPCSVLQTASGKILFDDYTRVDEKTWLVHPFTLVLDRKSEDDAAQPQPPLVLRCQTGARLFFSGPVTSISGSGLQIEQAQLEGKVELYRRSRSNQQRDELRIETSNIQINDQEINSIDDVAFRFGNHQGMGRRLTMRLNHRSEAGQFSRDISQINGISNIRLGILSSLMIMPTKRKSSGKVRLLSNDQTPIEITSRGPFEFDFNTSKARFIDTVNVRKMDQDGDSLSCDELQLQFTTQNGKNLFELDAAKDRQFELEHVLATGNSVLLNAPSKQARIEGQRIDYNLKQQLIVVSDNNQVEIAKNGDRFFGRSIQYLISPDKRLGTLFVDGPGQLLRNRGGKQFATSWTDRLILDRKNPRQHRLQIAGAVRTELDSTTKLNSDSIDLSIWEVPVYDANGQISSWEYQPADLTAQDNVHISSEKIIANTNVLRASWPNHPRAAQRLPQKPQRQELSATGLTNPPTQHHHSSGNQQQRPILRQSTIRPSYQSPVVQARRPVYQESVQPTPILARSQEIDIAIVDNNGEVEFSELLMNGNVILRKPSRENPNELEFEATSEFLELKPLGEGIYELAIGSKGEQFAELISAHLKITGQKMLINQAHDRVWIDGPGHLQTQQQIQQPNQPSDEFDVSFSGGMIFDGKQIYFEQNVAANIRQRKKDSTFVTQSTGTALSITLDRAIDFNRISANDRQHHLKSQERAKVIEFAIRQHLPAAKRKFSGADQADQPVVIFNRKFDSNGELAEQLKLQCPYAKYEENNQQLKAFGPGAIQIYRTGDAGRSASGFGFVGASKSADTNSASITYIHTNFENQLIANQQSAELSILGNLRSVYAKVNSYDVVFDPDRARDLPESAVRLNCERVDLVRSNNPLGLKPASQFTASGNVHIQSDRLDAQAETITYRDNTDVLNLLSGKGRDVTLTTRRDANSQWGQQIFAENVYYRISDNTAHFQNPKGASAKIGRR